VDICSLIDDIFIMIKNSRLFKEKENVRLEIVSKIKEKVFVNTDEDRLRQVITNLLNNALKFTSKGSVELGCEVVDDYIQFYVKDTGIGITEELMGRIFDRFYKIEKTKNVIYGGNGLGLTITKNIVDALDGEIWVESEEGKGTTFWFTIPK
jgi:signal transduction histidine kinase